MNTDEVKYKTITTAVPTIVGSAPVSKNTMRNCFYPILSVLAAAACIGLADNVKAQTPPPLGYVYKQFSLNNSGFDTAGGNAPNENYLHTSSGIEQRDVNGNLVTTIGNPSDIYGIASDGTDLFASSVSGTTIFRYLGDNEWTDGLGISESGARGLAATATNFYLVTQDGANIARIDRSTGATLNKYDISSILGEGYGLDVIPATNELLATNGTADIYRLKLKSDLSGIESWSSVTTTGIGSSILIGAGYNTNTNTILLNESEDTGQYAYGIPEPSDLNQDGIVNLVDFSMLAGNWLENLHNFGEVYKQFSLGNSGFDTAGGNAPDKNYFHTSSGIEQRDVNGNLVTTIGLPGDIYGLANDGTSLFASNSSGSKIYRLISDTEGWTGGLGISESGARGLAVTATDFYLITQDGANIARIDRSTGATLNKYDISSILGEGLGLDYIPATDELIVTNGTDNIYMLKLTKDKSAIESWNSVVTTGITADQLIGIGYNLSTDKLILNQSNNIGMYAVGPKLEVLVGDINGDGVVNLIDLSLMVDKWLKTESWHLP